MTDGSAPAGDLFVPFKDRQVEKKIGCWNCQWYSTGSEVLERWWKDAKVQGAIAKIKMLIQFTGLQLSGLDEGDAGLLVAQMRGKGMTEVEAVMELEKRKLVAAKQAVRMFGITEAEWADKRLEPFRNVIAGMNTGKMGVCTGKGVNKDDAPLLNSPIFSGYHCHQWSGREGWSVAHGVGSLDMLPQELVARADEKATNVAPEPRNEEQKEGK